MKNILKLSTSAGVLLLLLQIGCGIDRKSSGQLFNPALGSLTPSSAKLIAGDSVQFSAPFDQTIWKVNGIVGGNAALGLIGQDGLYTAPPVAPKASLTITAVNVAKLDSADSANGIASATASVDVENPKPKIEQVGPSTVIWGTPASVSIMGTGFTPGSSVGLSGKAMRTTRLDSNHLSVSIPGNLSPGTFTLAVSNSGPGGGTSTAQITVANPQPILNGINPAAAMVGANDVQISLIGTGLTPQSEVQASGNILSASYIDSSHLNAVMPARFLNNAGVISLTVINGLPGGGTSATQQFTIANPQPVLNQINPATTTIRPNDITVTLGGIGFTPTSTVQASGRILSASYVDSSHLNVVIPASLLNVTGLISLTVTNGLSGGGTSSAQQFTITNPQPVLNQISPATTTIRPNDITVTLIGSGFIPASTVQASGRILSASYIDFSHLSVVVPANSLSIVGSVPLVVVNDNPGGGASATQQLIVGNPLPVLSSISPNAAVAGTEMTLQINGNGFVSGSQVLLGGQIVATTFINSNALSAAIPASGLGSGSEIDVTVANAAPGGGASQSLLLQVLGPGKVQNTNHPQVAQYSIQMPSGSTVEVEFGEDLNYGRNTWAQSASDASGTVNILVAGMKSFSTYHLRGKIHLASGDTIYDQDHTFNTRGLPSENLPGISSSTNIAQERSSGIELLNLITSSDKRLRTVISDLDGNVLWYYIPPPAEPYLFPFPIKLLRNGNFLINVAGGASSVLREVTLAGDTVRELSADTLNTALLQQGFSLQAGSFHHDFLLLENGHIILLVGLCKPFQDLPGYPGTISVCGDGLVDIDAQFKPVWTWSTFDHLDINRHPMYFPDWTHSNAVIYSQNDGNLILSMRHQHWVIKIDYQNGQGNGDILWRLGPGGDFTLSGTPDEWFYAQHYPDILGQDGPITKLVVFDNGNFRSAADQSGNCDGNDIFTTGPDPCYSRAAIFQIDEQLKTAFVLWDYKPGFFSFWGGDVQQLSNGNIEFDMSQPFSAGSRIMEVENTANPSVVWTMDIQPQHAYRALRIPSLYPGVVWDH